MLVRLNDLMVLRPEDFAVVNAPFARERLESGDVLEDGEHYLVELGACQSRLEFLQYDHDENRRLLVGECEVIGRLVPRFSDFQQRKLSSAQ